MNSRAEIHDPDLWRAFTDAEPAIADWYESGDYGKAVREITALADLANQYIAQQAPWTLAKQDGRGADVQAVCTMGINLFKVLIVYLAPVLPDTAQRSAKFLNLDALRWSDANVFLGKHRINVFEPLLTRIEADAVAKMIDETRATTEPGAAPTAAPVAEQARSIRT